MELYKIIYSFEVLDKVKNGESVFVLDRRLNEVMRVSNTTVGDLVKILSLNETEKNRFEFWTREKVEQ